MLIYPLLTTKNFWEGTQAERDFNILTDFCTYLNFSSLSTCGQIKDQN
jgi:hypothetical protein